MPRFFCRNECKHTLIVMVTKEVISPWQIYAIKKRSSLTPSCPFEMDTLSFQVSYFYYGPDGKKKCKCIVLRYTKRKYPFHTLTNISLLYSHSVSSLQTLELFENTYSLVLLFCEGQSSMLIICSFLFQILFYYQGHIKNKSYIYIKHLLIYFHKSL